MTSCFRYFYLVSALIMIILAFHITKSFVLTSALVFASFFGATLLAIGKEYGWSVVFSAFHTAMKTLSLLMLSFSLLFSLCKQAVDINSFLLFILLLFSSVSAGAIVKRAENVLRFWHALLLLGFALSVYFHFYFIFLNISALLFMIYATPSLTTLQVEVSEKIVGEFPAEIVKVSKKGVKKERISVSKIRLARAAFCISKGEVIAQPFRRLDDAAVKLLKKAGVKEIRIQRKVLPQNIFFLSILLFFLLILLVALLNTFRMTVV